MCIQSQSAPSVSPFQHVLSDHRVLYLLVIPFCLYFKIWNEGHQLLKFATPCTPDQIADVRHTQALDRMSSLAAVVWIASFGLWLTFEIKRVRKVAKMSGQGSEAMTRTRPVLLGILLASTIAVAVTSIRAAVSLSPILDWFKPIGHDQIQVHASAQNLHFWILVGSLIWGCSLLTLVVNWFRAWRKDGTNSPAAKFADESASLSG